MVVQVAQETLLAMALPTTVDSVAVVPVNSDRLAAAVATQAAVLPVAGAASLPMVEAVVRTTSELTKTIEAGVREGDGMIVISYVTIPNCVPGCTDATADNYDPEANFDNGTCEYLGCTDEAACNFDMEANVNDGSCIFYIDCAGNCGGSFITDECGNCFDPTTEGETFIFQHTGFLQTFVVPQGAAKLRIQAFGAQGGSWDGSGGGLGAHISGTFDVTAGQQLTLLVGGAGQNGDPEFRNAGGGGGSFVTDINDTPWLVAGGGGGLSSTPINGNSNASVTENGYDGFSPSNPDFFGIGGTAGNGATNAATGEACGGNGAGLLTDGEETQCTTMGTMTSGTAFINGGQGGVAACGVQTAGGFGGGGGGGCLGTGGGGGYSGGGGSYGIGGNAGGGGSYNVGNDAVDLPAINEGDGRIIITILPEPPCVLGCTDPLADNFNPDATDDDGTCIISGCTDETAANYDAAATNDDGSCQFPGCTYEGASNYDNTANVDDGSCIFDQCPAPAGCTDETACNYNLLAVEDDGSCILPDGCTDNDACNYNENALCDDGSCEYDSCVGCTDPAAINYDEAYTQNDGSCEYEGCTDETACNYDPEATIDNGSCDYNCHGCMYADAVNYDAEATYDNGSCVFEPAIQCGPDTYFDELLGMCMPIEDTCPQDLNEDGLINSSDLLNFLGAFGTSCE